MLPWVNSHKNHLGVTLIVIFAGSLFLAVLIANAMNLSSGAGAALWCGLIAAGFIGADKLQAAQKREDEIKSLQEQTTRLEREARERNRP